MGVCAESESTNIQFSGRISGGVFFVDWWTFLTWPLVEKRVATSNRNTSNPTQIRIESNTLVSG